MKQQTITKTDVLAKFCQDAAHEEYLTIDTEFMREHTYYPKLCLVQIGLAEKAVIIDPLAEELDLTPLFSLLRNPDVLKVFHAARQDLEIFYYLMGEMVTPVYDTQIAAMALGQNEQISYHGLVKKYLEIELDKASRMTQWDRRPLTTAQSQYALNDVIPLHELYLLQREELRGRETWVDQVLQCLCRAENLITEPENAWSLVKSKNLKSRQISALMAAAAWRERMAQRINRPRRWIISDESLVILAQAMPKTLDEAQQLRLRPQKIPHLGELLQTIQNDTPTPVIKTTKHDKNPNGDLLCLLQLAMQHCARKHNIAPSLLCSNKELHILASCDPHQAEWQDHPVQQGWRREVFGIFAEKIAHGSVVLRFHNRKMCFQPLEEVRS